jgi:hypothetical protein
MLTVADLRKALKGVSGKTPVVTKDHDHSKYEWNGYASSVQVLNQKDADPWDEPKDNWKIEGDYVAISV